MKRFLFPILSMWCFTASEGRLPAATPVVSQVHVVSVHVRDHAAFDAVFLLLQDTLKLPRVYGELSKPGNSERRLYAGFSVGNAYLEPCGPYATDPPFSPTHPARFHGLTFWPAVSITEAAAELDRRKISHLPVIGGGGQPSFIYLDDAMLTGMKQAVSLWEIHDEHDPVNLDWLRSSVDAAEGGTLRVRRLEEIWMASPGETNRAQWAKFLSPAIREGDVWSVGSGPALRFLPGDESRIEAIVLQVTSLEKARRALSQSNLLGQSATDRIELNPAKAFGLRIILNEARR